MKKNNSISNSERQKIKTCPFCFEEIRQEAIKCRFCGEYFKDEVVIENERLRSHIPQDLKLSVVIPVYNEKNTIYELVKSVYKVPFKKEVIIVDDYSDDGTKEVLEKIKAENAHRRHEKSSEELNDIKIFFHQKNQGKGAALRTAFGHITGDIVIVQDADLEYNPQEYSKLIKPILEKKADVVYGSRFIGETHRVLFFWHYVGNRLLTTLSNIFTDLNLTDMESCFKVFRSEVIKKIKIKENRFGFEPEITAKVAKLGCKIYEVPISYSGRDYTEGKKIGWKDGIRAIYSILKYNLFPK